DYYCQVWGTSGDIF
nr:immunoglobulin light chain junction region [Macaca mulatta]MOW66990.1 immunoglobulin light chain junction region [Macaca mulatta]MOW67181.1 immunoglobulin light chain junction region [Macaca mulatta]MOW67322.1 immunoglobulin light chain junction region [Macaca mulatta]MOW67606.1 immunoglobulin light chain junction region [Macaca mulatta]